MGFYRRKTIKVIDEACARSRSSDALRQILAQRGGILRFSGYWVVGFLLLAAAPFLLIDRGQKASTVSTSATPSLSGTRAGTPAPVASRFVDPDDFEPVPPPAKAPRGAEWDPEKAKPVVDWNPEKATPIVDGAVFKCRDFKGGVLYTSDSRQCR